MPRIIDAVRIVYVTVGRPVFVRLSVLSIESSSGVRVVCS